MIFPFFATRDFFLSVSDFLWYTYSMYVELIGYFGTCLVIISMLMPSVVKLRIINTGGSLVFAIYALMIKSYPTAAMNTSIIFINLFSLYRIFKRHREYTVVKTSIEDVFVRYFLSTYEMDIKKSFPVVNKAIPYAHAYLVCRGTDVAAIFLGTSAPDGAVSIKLDYVTPTYRGTSVEQYLWTWFSAQNLTKFIVDSPSPEYCKRLKKMNFTEQDGHWVRTL